MTKRNEDSPMEAFPGALSRRNFPLSLLGVARIVMAVQFLMIPSATGFVPFSISKSTHVEYRSTFEATRDDNSRFKASPWTVSTDAFPSLRTPGAAEYRLYVSIGREDGSWMDPRWGASGRRIEFSLDVLFSEAIADEEESSLMVTDNLAGQRSEDRKLISAEYARLRKGFDRMPCHGGAYRIDDRKTCRFFVDVNGRQDKNYDDVSVPKGPLYFSLPVFGNVQQLSQKEGLVSVRQMGWHTGWRRLESRIVGVFRAVAIDRARRKDGF